MESNTYHSLFTSKGMEFAWSSPARDYSQELDCPICLDVLNDAVLIVDCGHNLCDTCLSRHLTSCRTGLGKCPACRGSVTQTVIDAKSRRLCAAVSVSCHHNGCTWKGRQDQRKAHDRAAHPAPVTPRSGQRIESGQLGRAPIRQAPPPLSAGGAHPAPVTGRRGGRQNLSSCEVLVRLLIIIVCIFQFRLMLFQFRLMIDFLYPYFSTVVWLLDIAISIASITVRLLHSFLFMIIFIAKNFYPALIVVRQCLLIVVMVVETLVDLFN